ncbi:MAG: heparan-alpha-glucosaminide N-acetyltransferase domain-containing protein [Verrucomicrobiota bacterium]
MTSAPNETLNSAPSEQPAAMDPTPKPARILFIDMMRFIALVMMLQGHTVFQVLERDIRDGDSMGISIWLYLRGYTAPVFMTVSGMVFTYLLVLAVTSSGNLALRLRNGLRRVVTLLVWGYALRMPFELLLGRVPQLKLDVGLAVDVLHLIAFGLLGIIVVFLLCRPLLQRGVEYVAIVFFLLFLGSVQFSPYIAEYSFHRGVEPMISPSVLGVVVDTVSNGEGIEVKEVFQESRADKIGLVEGDVITRIGLEPIVGLESLARAEALQVHGKPSPLRVLRNDKEIEIDWVYERPLKVLPNALTFWLNRQPAPSGVASQFPIFPWTGYLMFGAGLGTLLAGMNRRNAIPRRLDLIFFVMGVSCMIWTEVAPHVARVWLGGGDSAIVFQRIGGVMLLASAMVFLSHWVKKLPLLVIQMSRNSLWLYIGHLILLYTILPKIYGEKFALPGTLVCVVLMFALMIGQTLLIEKKHQLGSWKSMFGFLFTAKRRHPSH